MISTPNRESVAEILVMAVHTYLLCNTSEGGKVPACRFPQAVLDVLQEATRGGGGTGMGQQGPDGAATHARTQFYLDLRGKLGWTGEADKGQIARHHH